MSDTNFERRTPPESSAMARILSWGAFGLAALGTFALMAFLSQTGAGEFLGRLIDRALALQSGQATWFVTRAAGWMAYLLLWLSTAWGMAMPTKLFDNFLSRTFTYDFHEFISLLALGFTGVHIGILLFDSYMPFSPVQLLLPFLSSYRPLWVTVGGAALFLSLLVTVTFYMRKRIGTQAFRRIHQLSLLAYFGAALHGLMSGTDSSLAAAQILYASTSLVVVFFLVYWIIAGLQNKAARPKQVNPARKLTT